MIRRQFLSLREMIPILILLSIFFSCPSSHAQPVDPRSGVASNPSPDALLDSVQCRLDAVSTPIRSIQYSSFLDQYIEISPIITYMGHEFVFDDDYTSNNPIIQVKVCWCAQYFGRRDAYCPIEFDACKVDGLEGPITCFHESEGGSFLRGFLFICCFWFVALVYALTCTDQGLSARAFILRKLCLRCNCMGRRRYNNEREWLQHDIETMIQRDPERATWMLRSAFLRERNLQRAQTNFYRWWHSLNSNRGQQEGNNDNMPGNNNDNDNSLSQWQQRMELKVKKYMPVGASGSVTEQTSNNSDSDPNDNGDDCEPDENIEVEAMSSSFSIADAASYLSTAISFNGGGAADSTCETHALDSCAICLTPLNIGDRVGDIPCGHLYCVECLKDWLKQKNHCPLCMRGGLATPAGGGSSNSADGSDNASRGSGDAQQQDVEEGVSSPRSLGSGISRSSNSPGLIVSLPETLPPS